jgi:hypothetical protein
MKAPLLALIGLAACSDPEVIEYPDSDSQTHETQTDDSVRAYCDGDILVIGESSVDCAALNAICDLNEWGEAECISNEAQDTGDTGKDTGAQNEGSVPQFLTHPLAENALVKNAWQYSYEDFGAELPHEAIDYQADQGDAVHASCDGRALVTYGEESIEGQGTHIKIRCDEKDPNGNAYQVTYGNLNTVDKNLPVSNENPELEKDPDQWRYVYSGDLIATVGQAPNGQSLLHFEVRAGAKQKETLDPYDLYKNTYSSSSTSEQYYPPNGADFSGCGDDSLWTSCPDTQESTLLDEPLITTGGEKACAVSTQGDLKCWGHSDTDDYPLANESIIAMDMFDDALCTVTEGNDLYCYGDFMENSDELKISLYASEVDYIQIATGDDFYCGLKADGSVECEGEGVSDLFGSNSDAPNGNYTQIDASKYNACGITTENEIKCWGYEWESGSYTFTTLEGSYSKLALGTLHTACAINADTEEIDCWSLRGSELDIIPPSGDFKDVSVGDYEDVFCGLTSKTGEVKCSGEDGDEWMVINAPESKGLSSIAASHEVACSVSKDEISCWGYEYYDEISSAPTWADFE